jgi:carbonic anhydrase
MPNSRFFKSGRKAATRLRLRTATLLSGETSPKAIQAKIDLALLHRREGDFETADRLWNEATASKTGQQQVSSIGMHKVVHGARLYGNKVFRQERELFERLAHGQHPEILFICCGDSRVAPDHIMQVQPGELFVLRNAGNIVPAYGEVSTGGEAASIEFAVNAVGVKDIIVCGHSHCGAMHGLLHPENLRSLPATQAFLEHARAALKTLDTLPEWHDDNERVLKLAKANVLLQIEHLKTHPSVAKAMSEGRLNLHGWVYRIELGEIRYCDRSSGKWETL